MAWEAVLAWRLKSLLQLPLDTGYTFSGNIRNCYAIWKLCLLQYLQLFLFSRMWLLAPVCYPCGLHEHTKKMLCLLLAMFFWLSPWCALVSLPCCLLPTSPTYANRDGWGEGHCWTSQTNTAAGLCQLKCMQNTCDSCNIWTWQRQVSTFPIWVWWLVNHWQIKSCSMWRCCLWL